MLTLTMQSSKSIQLAGSTIFDMLPRSCKEDSLHGAACVQIFGGELADYGRNINSID
jgi:hypothetical protein